VTPHELRDELLVRAVDVVDRARRAGDDPALLAALLRSAWHGLTDAVVADDEFHPDVATGVEALGFLAGPGAGGVVLRLAGELPDSFERLDVGPAVASAAGVRHAYFGSGRAEGAR
jgi:hypothetical protein